MKEAPAMTRWTLDPVHTEVGFSVRHLMVSTVKGQFRSVAAEVELDPDHPERSRVNATIDAASLDTGNPERDGHLRSADFLDVERFPTVVYRSTAVHRVREGEVEIAGELTIRDVTRPVALRGSFGGPVTDPWGGRRAGFELTGEIDREAFGLTWNVALESGGVLVGKSVRLHVTAEVAEAVPAAA
jgi:polyisoprenoid-binding protein YceI